MIPDETSSDAVLLHRLRLVIAGCYLFLAWNHEIAVLAGTSVDIPHTCPYQRSRRSRICRPLRVAFAAVYAAYAVGFMCNYCMQLF